MTVLWSWEPNWGTLKPGLEARRACRTQQVVFLHRKNKCSHRFGAVEGHGQSSGVFDRDELLLIWAAGDLE